MQLINLSKPSYTVSFNEKDIYISSNLGKMMKLKEGDRISIFEDMDSAGDFYIMKSDLGNIVKRRSGSGFSIYNASMKRKILKNCGVDKGVFKVDKAIITPDGEAYPIMTRRPVNR